MEKKLLEVQITQTRHPQSILQKTILSSRPQKGKKIFMKVYYVRGAHLQCVNNHYAKYENKRMKILELQITQTRQPLRISDGKNVLSSTFVKN